MILMIPVDVLCRGCGECPRLTIRSDSVRTGEARVHDQRLECAHLTECLDVRSALARHWEIEEEKKGREQDA